MSKLPAFLFFSLTASALHAGITPGSMDLGAIWFIGDSITQSNADGDAYGSPRKSLYDRLTAGGYTFTFTGHITDDAGGLPVTGGTPATNLYQYHSGISGSVISNNGVLGRTDMTNNLSSQWGSGRLATVKPDIVLIMLGTNDIDLLSGRGGGVADVADDMRTYVTNLYALNGSLNPTVFISTIAPNNTNAGDNDNVLTFNALLPGVVSDLQAAPNHMDVHLVDAYTPLNANSTTAMQSDKLHPNSVGNGIIADTWYAGIQSLSSVPEPSTYGLMGAGALAAATLIRRRRDRRA